MRVDGSVELACESTGSTGELQRILFGRLAVEKHFHSHDSHSLLEMKLEDRSVCATTKWKEMNDHSN